MKIGLLNRFVALAIVGAVAVPTVSVASTTLTAAKACRAAITLKGKTYANARRRLLLACADRLLKCNLQIEVEGHTAGTCLSLATSACNTKLGSASDSSLNLARTRFHDKTVLACLAYPFASIMSTTSGGLWYSNDTTCNGSADLPALITCLRDEIDLKVDEVVGRVKPRAGLLLDNIGLGSLYPNLPRPPITDIVISLSPPNTDGGTLVLTPDPSTSPIPNGNAIRFTGDATSLPCGGGMGNNGKITIDISTAANPCTDPNALEHTIKQPYGAGETAVFGPLDADQNICLHLKDPGGMGGGCDITQTSAVDYNPGGVTPPTTSSASLLACQTRLHNKVKAFARYTATKLHGCSEKVVRCKLANEIDAVDPTSCLASATSSCSTIPAAIDTKLAAFKDPVKITAIPRKCGLVPFADLQPFVGGLGFSNVAAGCSGTADLNALMDCILGTPTTASSTQGTKCSVEHKVFIRDPRANDSLTSGGLNPGTQFPCVGP